MFRERFLPPSETFVQDHLLQLPTWTPAAVTMHRVADGLEVPGVPLRNAGQPARPVRLRNKLLGRLGVDEQRLRARALKGALREHAPTVIHAHFGPDAALVLGPARELEVPLVATFHGFDATVYPEILRQQPSGARLIEAWAELMAGVAAIITVSGFLRDQLLARGADPGRMHVVPCGVDTSRLPWTPPPADGNLLFVGRLVEKKGCSDLLEAVAALPERPRVRIIGDGPLRGELEAQAQRLRIPADFLGVRGREHVMDEMRLASIVAMPSQRAPNGDCEGLPVVSLEASAVGRPVVGYQHSGMVESVLSGETGVLVREGDVAGLASSLRDLIGQGPELERLARNARDHVERNFELRSCLERVEGVYEEVAGLPES